MPDVRQHPQDPTQSNGYIFFRDGGKRAALVDPAGSPATYCTSCAKAAIISQYILITHKHTDHCDATADVARHFRRHKS